jgi:hypothetical protein
MYIYINLVSVGQSENFNVINCGIARVIIRLIEWSVINAEGLDHFLYGWLDYLFPFSTGHNTLFMY